MSIFKSIHSSDIKDNRSISVSDKQPDSEDPLDEFLEVFDAYVRRFPCPIPNKIARQLQDKPDLAIQDVAKALINFAKQNGPLDKLAAKSNPTPNDILTDPLLATICQEILSSITSLHNLKTTTLNNLPTSKEVQSSSGKSLRDKLTRLSAAPVDQKEFSDLLQRCCLQAAQNGNQAITFTLEIASLANTATLNDQEKFTLGLLLTLFPNFTAITDDAGPLARENNTSIKLFLTQLKHFAMTERLAIIDNKIVSSQDLIREFKITLSWEPGLSMEDAVRLSNQAIEQDKFNSLLAESQRKDDYL